MDSKATKKRDYVTDGFLGMVKESVRYSSYTGKEYSASKDLYLDKDALQEYLNQSKGVLRISLQACKDGVRSYATISSFEGTKTTA